MNAAFASAARRLLRAGAALLFVIVTELVGSPATASPRFAIEGLAPGAPFTEVLRHEAESAHALASSWYHQELDGPVRIVWVSGSTPPPEFRVSIPSTVAGLAVPERGLILLFAPSLGSRPDRLRPVLLHEMCHLVLGSRTSRAELAPPRWLDEGLAMWISGTWDLGLDWRSDDASLLADAAAAGSLLPLEELDSGFPGGPFFHLAYAQSFSFVRFLVERHGGEENLRRFVRRLASNEDAEPAFRSTYGISLADAERVWRDSVHPSGILGRLPSARTLTIFASVVAGALVFGRFVQVRRRLARPDPEVVADAPPVSAHEDVTES